MLPFALVTTFAWRQSAHNPIAPSRGPLLDSPTAGGIRLTRRADKVVVVGLDCAPPALVFERFRDSMPNVAGLMERGVFGPLRSTSPPITVPAWTSMVSGRDPGELGLYGFRDRRGHDYGLSLVTSRDLREKRVWDRIGEAGLRVCALFVPLTWPPTPVNGEMVSCFLTPSLDDPYTYPPALAREIEERFGPLELDVADLGGGDESVLLARLYAMARQHFAIADHLLATRSPDFLMMVEMGPDRLHHALFDRLDPGPGRAYYAFLDQEIGRLAARLGPRDVLLVVSDHGARPLEGGFHINEWLIERGYLVLRGPPPPSEPTPLTPDRVDWSRTRAWGEGGYYARVFLNMRGREREGIIEPADRAALTDRLRNELARVTLADGRVIENRVDVPATSYRAVRGSPPDLCVYFDDLRLRSLGSVGTGRLYSPCNDTRPDACNHDWDGIFVMAGGQVPARGRVEGLEIYDVNATVLGLLGVAAPHDLLGRDRSTPR